MENSNNTRKRRVVQTFYWNNGWRSIGIISTGEFIPKNNNSRIVTWICSKVKGRDKHKSK